jgi:hypothetical protein
MMRCHGQKSSKDGELETKHPYVCHAELNAVLNKNSESCRGCRLYCTLHPCNECAKVIIQAGIRQVVYASDKHRGRNSTRASRRLFDLAGVKTRLHNPAVSDLHISLRYQEDREPSPEPSAPSTPLKPRALANLQSAAPPEAKTGNDAINVGRKSASWALVAPGLFLMATAMILSFRWRR